MQSAAQPDTNAQTDIPTSPDKASLLASDSQSFLVARFGSSDSTGSGTVTSGGSAEIPEMKTENPNCCETTKTAIIIGLFNCARDYVEHNPGKALIAGMSGLALVGVGTTAGIIYAGTAIINAAGTTGLASAAINAGTGIVSGGVSMLVNHGIRWLFFKPADDFNTRQAVYDAKAPGSPRAQTDLRRSTAVDINAQRRRGSSKGRKKREVRELGSKPRDPETPMLTRTIPEKPAEGAVISVAVAPEADAERVAVDVGSIPKSPKR